MCLWGCVSLLNRIHTCYYKSFRWSKLDSKSWWSKL